MKNSVLAQLNITKGFDSLYNNEIKPNSSLSMTEIFDAATYKLGQDVDIKVGLLTTVSTASYLLLKIGKQYVLK